MSRQSIWMGLLRRDLLLAARRSADVVSVLFFFIIAASLFPLGAGADPALLRAVAPGVLWVAALLSTMLSLGRLFAADLADGTLEQMLLSPQPLVMTVAIKTLAHWLVSGVPLVFLAPVLGLQFDLAGREILVLTVSLLLGTPVLSLIGAIGAALTLGVRGGNVLVAVLVLPLYIPVLIFGAGAVAASAAGLSAQAGLSLVGAMLALSVVFAPYAAAAALRIAME